MRSSNRPGPTDYGEHLPDELGDLGELADVEELLRAMPLRQPGHAIDARVRGLLGRESERRGRLAWLAAAAAIAIAAGVAPLVWQAVGSGQQHSVSDTVNPAATNNGGGGGRAGGTPAPLARAVYPAPRPLPGLRVERTVDRVTDEGIVGRLGDMPLQRYRRQSVEQVWVIDPQQGTRVRATVPRDEIVVVGVRPF